MLLKLFIYYLNYLLIYNVIKKCKQQSYTGYVENEGPIQRCF